ncbi:hypothetical protein AAEU32_14925 [Pseudoalteromonas sp. SSDWG2]|uniref:hypothetical protein n=1 Tax=Pseudoalteromonas sp. SSDWG2 TaxID=3139391 RepID=UPI003BAC5CAE
MGWLLHPVWDVGLHLIVQDGQFAPLWYVYLCISFDVVVALGIVNNQKNLISWLKGA